MGGHLAVAGNARSSFVSASGYGKIPRAETQTTNFANLEGVNAVRNFLETLVGKDLDVQCDGAVISGKVIKVEGNVLQLEKEETICYVNIDKVVAVWESRERKAQSPGFLPTGK